VESSSATPELTLLVTAWQHRHSKQIETAISVLRPPWLLWAMLLQPTVLRPLWLLWAMLLQPTVLRPLWLLWAMLLHLMMLWL
jgi:hypothetical protein